MAVLDASSSAVALQMQAVTLGSFSFLQTELFRGDVGVPLVSSTRLVLSDLDTGARVVWGGSGVTYSPLALSGASVVTTPLTGTATSLTLFSPTGDQVFRLSGISVALSPTQLQRSVLDIFFAANDTILGGAGDDLLDGHTGTDSIVGGDGNDVILGGAGADVIDGGDDVDTVSYAAQAAPIAVSFAAAGASTVVTSTGNDSLRNIENVLGSSGNDTITGHATTAVHNLFNGGAGNDRLDGGAGDDTVIGGLGTDTLIGGAGSDTVDFSAEAPGSAVLANLATGAVSVVNGALRVAETATGFENAVGTAGNDTLTGTDAANRLTGQAGADLLSGGGGNDTLDGTETTASYGSILPADTLAGGLGDDLYLLQWGNGSSQTDVVNEAAGQGTDTVQLTFDTNSGYSYAGRGYQMTANVEHIVLDNSGYYTSGGKLAVMGNALNNSMTVQGSTSGYYYSTPGYWLYGGGGNDTLLGGGNNDVLSGDAGNDLMVGGVADDTYVIDSAGDVVVEQAYEGTDTVVTSINNYTLGANFENLRLEMAPGVLNGTGNATTNVLTGNDLNNLLNGLDGSDTLYGGVGNDTLNGGSGNDSIAGGIGDDVLDGGTDDSSYYSGWGGDTVSYAGLGVRVTVDLALSTAQNTGAGSDRLLNFENLTGGAAADVLRGNGLANRIQGGAGNDLIQGRDGADTLQGENGNDTLAGGAGIDVLTGGAGNDVFDFDTLAEISTLVYGSYSSDSITDFTRGQDRIDLSTIDANSATVANEAFTVVLDGTTVFTAAGQLKLVGTQLLGNTDTDAEAEFALQLTGVRTLSMADFIG